MKKGMFFCLTLVTFGLIDLITTLVGTICFGAVEANPALAGVTTASPLFFVGTKLVAVAFIGLIFYKIGDAQVSGISPKSGTHLIQMTYSSALVFLTAVVTNNVIVVANLA